jgi:hypothetical protein
MLSGNHLRAKAMDATAAPDLLTLILRLPAMGCNSG